MDKTKLPLLLEPFDPKDIEWRVQRAGTVRNKAWAIVLAYVTNRAIQERLDKVVGVENWKNEFTTAPDGGVLCGISVRFDEWITKYDGAENTKTEAIKGGLSSAMKRAAVQWGIGRYLYKLDNNLVNMTDQKPENMTDVYVYNDKTSNTKFYWKAPRLPDWALPKERNNEN